MVARQSMNVNAVSEKFRVSRTAVYKHLKILTECGLVILKQKGRERYCEARLDQLLEVSHWLHQYKVVWEARCDSLEKYLNTTQYNQGKKRLVAKKKK
jgi:DNA-binding transcriptional ArsR family regulator